MEQLQYASNTGNDKLDVTTSNSEFKILFDFTTAPCGPGTYGAYAYGFAYLDGEWMGDNNGVWSGQEVLAAPGAAASRQAAPAPPVAPEEPDPPLPAPQPLPE